MASNKLTKHNLKHGKFKQKTRQSTKEWKEERTKKFWKKREESNKNKIAKAKTIVEIKPSTIDWANKKRKEEEDYGYFLSRGESC